MAPAIPIVGGIVALLGATAVALRLRAKSVVPGQNGVAPGAVVAIPGGTGSVVVPTALGPGQTVPNVSISQLPPIVQQSLQGPGAPANQNFVNAVAIQLAQGVPAAQVAATTLKATNGLLFDPTASAIMTGLAAGNIQGGDSVTFDVGKAGFNISSVPSGSSILKANGPCTDTQVSGTFIDPRIPDQTTVFTIPLSSVTGISLG